MTGLYENIGGKIKNWAITIFVIEAIAAIISGIVMLSNDINLAGALTMIVGPFVAWVSSWLLYGFGELIETTAANESNTRKILEFVQNQRKDQPQVAPEKPQANNDPQGVPQAQPQPVKSNIPTQTQSANNENILVSAAAIKAEDGEIICPNCGTKQRSNRKVCWKCSQKFLNN
jgi:hypothetical protein